MWKIHSCSKEWCNQRNQLKIVAADSWGGSPIKINGYFPQTFLRLFQDPTNFNSLKLSSVPPNRLLLKIDIYPSHFSEISTLQTFVMENTYQAVSPTYHHGNYPTEVDKKRIWWFLYFQQTCPLNSITISRVFWPSTRWKDNLTRLLASTYPLYTFLMANSVVFRLDFQTTFSYRHPK